jgi:hypothetical protein
MIKLTAENTQRAIEKCNKLKPKVKFIKDRLFVVYSSNNSNVYHVRFDVQNGEKLGVCECQASEKGLVCYRLIAGATANIFRQGLKRQTA